jgi:thymidylate synthase (FAD)
MLEQAKEVAPNVFKKAGPKCIPQGACPEGKMTCGRYREMVAKYASG